MACFLKKKNNRENTADAKKRVLKQDLKTIHDYKLRPLGKKIEVCIKLYIIFNFLQVAFIYTPWTTKGACGQKISMNSIKIQSCTNFKFRPKSTIAEQFQTSLDELRQV